MRPCGVRCRRTINYTQRAIHTHTHHGTYSLARAAAINRLLHSRSAGYSHVNNTVSQLNKGVTNVDIVCHWTRRPYCPPRTYCLPLVISPRPVERAKTRTYSAVSSPAVVMSLLDGWTWYNQASFLMAPNQAYLLWISQEWRDLQFASQDPAPRAKQSHTGRHSLDPGHTVHPARGIACLSARPFLPYKATPDEYHSRINAEACSGLTCAPACPLWSKT